MAKPNRAIFIVLLSAACAAGHQSSDGSCSQLTAESITADVLANCLPPAAGELHLSRVVAALPQHGEVKRFGREGRDKLETLREFIGLLGREGSWELKIVQAPQAAAGLFERSVVIISEPTFVMLSSVELRALLAHEFGHEYVWRQYEESKAGNDYQRLRELELVCDRVAVITLDRFNFDFHHLQSGLRKMSEYNLERFGAASNTAQYPPLETRMALITQWAKLHQAKSRPRSKHLHRDFEHK